MAFTPSRYPARKGGFTLIELTMAMSVFMLVMGFTAEVLVSYYATLDITHQKTEALRNAAGVLNAMRAVRDAESDDFPTAITEQWPQGAVVRDTESTAPADRVTSLPGETLTITYLDAHGEPIEGAVGRDHNPLHVRVTSRWKTLRGGRWAEVSVTTALTDV